MSAQGHLNWAGQGLVLGFALPNFYFHFTTAYNILRQMGVDIGKRDFISSLTLHDDPK